MNNLPPRELRFPDFWELHPHLSAIDEYLDLKGVPVCYRVRCLTQFLNQKDTVHVDSDLREAANVINARLTERALNLDIVLTWYTDVYEHLTTRLPASSLVIGVAPLPVVVTVGNGVCALPGSIAANSLIYDHLQAIITEKPELLHGQEVFSELTPTPWVLLAMSSYDMAISCFRQARPPFNLSIWETAQAMEKLFKAILIAKNYPQSSIKKLGHSPLKIIKALLEVGAALSPRSSDLAHSVLNTGQPCIRYGEGQGLKERHILKNLALEVHHKFLSFCSIEEEMLLEAIPCSSATSFPFCTATVEELRTEINSRHCQSSRAGYAHSSCNLRD